MKLMFSQKVLNHIKNKKKKTKETYQDKLQ